MAKNNGHPFDFFAYRADAGQSIQDAFEFYSEFVLTGDRRAHTGYYAGDKAVRVGFLPLMEIAHRIYPDNARFTLVLQARPRVRYDVETFGWTAPLLHACDDVVDRVGQWEFEIAQEMEGWSIDRNLKMQVRDGQLHLQLTGSGPGILSPAELELSAREFPRLLIRMRNETSDDRANVFFTTDKHTSFAGSDLFFDVHPHDDQYRDYVIDMTRHARWTGQLKQLRIDVVHSTSEGKVAVDAIRLLRESPDRHSAQ
jgi:hypothetical protein